MVETLPMFDDVATLFYDHVLKSYKDYVTIKNNGVIGQSQDIRAATEAATALYHFREHLPDSMSIRFDDVVQQCPDYRLVRDIANASKHGSIDRNQPLITSATALEEFVFLTEYRDELGPYVHTEKTIMVKLDGGSTKNLSSVLRNVINFWIGHVQSKGILPQIKSFNSPSKEPVSRENARGLDMVATQGMMFGKKSFGILRYDYQKKVAVPVNLTDAKVQFRVYKPAPITIDLNVKVNGRTFTSSLTLDEAHSLKARALKTDEERRDFAQGLPEFKELFSELCLQAKAWQEQVESGTADLNLLDGPEDQTTEGSDQRRPEGYDSFYVGGTFEVTRPEGELDES